MLEEVYSNTNEKMEKAIEALKKEFISLRTGKVSTLIVENIKVDYYGTMTPLSQVGSIVATDATTININPWEKNLLKNIEKSIQEGNIGVNPNNDGDSIKLYFPPMTVEQRQATVKQAKVMLEKAKVSIRNIRKDSNDNIKKLEKNKEITQDDSKKGLEEVQKITDNYISKTESIFQNKEQEILKV